MTLNSIPKFDFSSIDNFFKNKAVVPGESESTKGYKYFSEKYIHNIKSKFLKILHSWVH